MITKEWELPRFVTVDTWAKSSLVVFLSSVLVAARIGSWVQWVQFGVLVALVAVQCTGKLAVSGGLGFVAGVLVLVIWAFSF